MKIEHSQTNGFVGITFFGHVILRRHDYFVSMLEVYYSYVNMNFYLESFGSEHSCHNKENYIENYDR